MAIIIESIDIKQLGADAANIVVFPSDMYAEVGERVYFGVVVKGEPYPTLTWYHNDVPIKNDDSFDIQLDGSLCILSAQLKHSGVYKLLAKNNNSSAEREARLTVTQAKSEVSELERSETQSLAVSLDKNYLSTESVC